MQGCLMNAEFFLASSKSLSVSVCSSAQNGISQGHTMPLIGWPKGPTVSLGLKEPGSCPLCLASTSQPWPFAQMRTLSPSTSVSPWLRDPGSPPASLWAGHSAHLEDPTLLPSAHPKSSLALPGCSRRLPLLRGMPGWEWAGFAEGSFPLGLVVLSGASLCPPEALSLHQPSRLDHCKCVVFVHSAVVGGRGVGT